MFNINNKYLISLGAGLFVFATIVFLAPNNVKADICRTWRENDYTFSSCDNTRKNTNYNNNDNGNNYNNTNPIPFINSINLNSTNTTITVLGNNFVQGSVVKLNNYPKTTTFIDSGTLQAQINYSGLNNKEEYFITVFNPAPGGGYSNAVSFTVNNYVAPVTNNNTTKNTTISKTKNVTNTTAVNKNTIENDSKETNANADDQNVKDLAAGAIFGSNAFMPSSLLQWIFFTILILLAVILWRKLYVSDEDKHTPLKHA
jgi:hypothetical protein